MLNYFMSFINFFFESKDKLLILLFLKVKFIDLFT